MSWNTGNWKEQQRWRQLCVARTPRELDALVAFGNIRGLTWEQIVLDERLLREYIYSVPSGEFSSA